MITNNTISQSEHVSTSYDIVSTTKKSSLTLTSTKKKEKKKNLTYSILYKTSLQASY